MRERGGKTAKNGRKYGRKDEGLDGRTIISSAGAAKNQKTSIKTRVKTRVKTCVKACVKAGVAIAAISKTSIASAVVARCQSISAANDTHHTTVVYGVR